MPTAPAALAAAHLVIGETLHGRLTVRDAVSGRVVSEVAKPAGVPVELGLDPGSYELTLEDEKAVLVTRGELAAGERAMVSDADFVPVGGMALPARPAPVAAAAPPAAPAPRLVHVPLQLTIGVGGPPAIPQTRVVNHFVLGLLLGDADLMHGLELSLVGNRATELRGAQLSVAFNLAGGGSRGLQAATGFNLVSGDFHGAQTAAGFNTVNGNLHGFQAAAGFNVANGDMHGFQAAAGFNVVKGNLHGFQAASGVNVLSGNLDGFQAAAGVNVLGGFLHGAQLSSGLNFADGVGGLQLALVNFAGDVHGAQIGLVNVARSVRGTQVGLVNLSRDAAAPIGLINLVSEGQHHLAVWTNEVGAPHLGLKLGGRVLYGILFGGLYPKGTDRAWDASLGTRDRERYAAGLGFGAHFAGAGATFVDLELLGAGIHEPWSRCACANQDEGMVLGTARLLIGFQLARYLAVFGGPSYNVLTSWNGKDAAYNRGTFENVITSGATTVRMYPGLVLGAQI